MTTLLANHRPALDAAGTSCLLPEGYFRRASEAGRWTIAVSAPRE